MITICDYQWNEEPPLKLLSRNGCINPQIITNNKITINELYKNEKKAQVNSFQIKKSLIGSINTIFCYEIFLIP